MGRENDGCLLWVLNRRKRSWQPQKPAILLEKALQGAATGPAIQPDCDFIYGASDCRFKHEEQRSRGVLLVDWHQSGVQLANVKVDIGQRIDLVFCGL